MFRFNNLVKFNKLIYQSSCKPYYAQHQRFSFLFYQPHCIGFANYLHFTPKKAKKSVSLGTVGIFWDLDNKHPNTVSPFDAAIRLRKAARAFGDVKYMVAYANSHAFSYVPEVVRERRRERRYLNEMESKGVIKSVVAYKCSICGRKFNTNDKLLEHFEYLHEREQRKRLGRLDRVKGSKKVNLAAKLAMKMEKYKYAADRLLVPKEGYGLAEDIKRAGFWVHLVSDKPQAADIALRYHMVELMDHGRVQCLVLVSDDSGFRVVLEEAKLRCLKTVVVGDTKDGALKRCADASFSWRDVIVGKAQTQGVSVVGRLKDRDVLKNLEWSYKPELEKSEVDFVCSTSKGEDEGIVRWDDKEPWWKLDSKGDETPSKSLK